MVLQLSALQVQQLIAHATRTYPEECCGLLLGHLTPDRLFKQATKTKKVTKVWETVNAWNPEVGAELTAIIHHIGIGKRDRFWIDPQDLLTAQRYARDHQLNIVGVYHSHPDHPAVPSESDRRLAWSDYSYLILSVRSGVVSDYRCWTLDDQQQFRAEEVRTQQ
ncbi:MAG: M67 family metallopeptidase [Timaviella obliquedivisa GSE-PSE-MK23-08B]|jgi:proteasome lid subunit RPN8/RPN11|nr:M67 family metallopeptidase [Timaviella obliquedivisa GSE-PSE-MK23-08B]